MLSSNRPRVIKAGIAAITIGGSAYGIVACTSSSSTTTGSDSANTAQPTASSSQSPATGSGANARSGPAAGGAIGTVSSVSTTGFTLTTAGSQKETITKSSSTTYEKGTSRASVSAVTNGETALVLGTTDNKTITATQVIVNPPSSNETSPGGKVIPYSKGTQGSTQQVGTIPSNYTQGSGTLESGTTADKGTEAALGVYPGGVVDRVVSIGNGDYEVHNIGVNWPHHIFVNSDFKVIGAND
jgi:membrane-bound inhibitor of C-type lysozyme